MIPTESESVTEISTADPYEIQTCAQWIEKNQLCKVCLQFPDDLLQDSVDVATQLEKRLNKKVYILGDTSFGSCCVDEIAAEHISADGIIHFGHACLNPTVRLPVFHVLPKKEIAIKKIIEKFQSIFQDCNTRILFFYDVQYAYIIKYISKELNLSYKNLVFTTLNCMSNVPFTDTVNNSSSIILGRCMELESECRVQDYDAFFLGDNEKTFTTLALSIPAKAWYYFDNDTNVPFGVTSLPWLKRRRYLVEKLKDAKVVGIVVATLGIKEYLNVITMIKNILKQQGIKTYILSVGKINPAKLANFPEIDIFVLITCPENEVFESRDFLKPLLLPYEVELAFNTSRTLQTEYCMDFRQILPGGMVYKEFKPSVDSDVSLITGELRAAEPDTACVNEMNALVIKTSGAVAAIGKAGAQFLQDRSWKGVEQRLGKDAIEPATIGRTGLPLGYENEPIPKL